MRTAILAIFSLMAALSSTAQQVNPVPDYVFGNRMSAGRTTVTDTSAYFSIGPRFNATRGMQPPMVGDTAAVTGTKRNGLLIFSMQKNKYAYWDSASTKWREFGAGSLTSITAGTGLTGGTITTYGTIAADTLTLSTRAWRQKGIDSVANVRIGGSGTINRVPKFTASGAIGDGSIVDSSSSVRMTISPAGEILVNTTTDAGTYALQVAGSIYNTTGAVLAATSGNVSVGTTNVVDKLYARNDGTTFATIGVDNQGTISATTGSQFLLRDGGTAVGFLRRYRDGTGLIQQGFSDALAWVGNVTSTPAERMRLNSSGELLIGTTTDAGAYALQVAGSIYNTTGAVLAASSGGVRIGDATAAVSKLDVQGNISATTNYRFSNNAFSQIAIQDANGAFAGGYNLTLSGATPQHAVTGGISGYQFIGGTNNSTLRFIADSSRAAGTNAAIRMSILPSGNVGIGTSSPSELLHVNGRARIVTIDSAASPINLLWANVNGVIQKTAVASVIGSGTANYIPKFATATTFDNSLIYQASSEVFINTTTDAGDFKLQVSGNSLVSDGQFRVNANANNGIVLSRSGTNSVVMYTSNTSGIMELGVAGSTGGTGTGFTGYAGYLMTEAAYPLQFGSVDTMRMTLNEQGELIISTNAGDNGNYKLQVLGNAYVQLETHMGATGDFGAYTLQVTGETIFDGAITTQQPGGSIVTKIPWRLGNVDTVTPTSPNRTISVEINGTTYYIHAKTTND